MQQATIPAWVRGVHRLAVGVAPIFVTLGVIHRTPEWALAGVALAVYGLLGIWQWRRLQAQPDSPGDPA